MKLVLAVLVLIPTLLCAQEPEPPIFEEVIIEPQETEIPTFAEVMPSFPGGEAAMHQFIVKNIKYPAIDKERGIQGRVYIKFVVEIDGSISNIEILRGLSNSINAECIRVIKRMPKWTAANQRGNKIRCYYTLPFTFKLA